MSMYRQWAAWFGCIVGVGALAIGCGGQPDLAIGAPKEAGPPPTPQDDASAPPTTTPPISLPDGRRALLRHDWRQLRGHAQLRRLSIGAALPKQRLYARLRRCVRSAALYAARRHLLRTHRRWLRPAARLWKLRRAPFMRGRR